MALIASAPVLTARGDELNETDGFVANCSIVKRMKKTEESEDKSGSEATEPDHSLLNVGNCQYIRLDSETGFVGMTTVLKYTELLCSDDRASLKKTVASWFKMPTSMAIATALMRRDRGTSQFLKTSDDETDIFVHPVQLLANVEVGASTRTWLVSVAAFMLSYHQITKAFEQYPQDFQNIDVHISALQARVKALHSRSGSRKLRESALALVKAPYGDFNYQAVAHDALNRLALLARADLVVMKYLRKLIRARKAKKTSSGCTAVDVTVEQLRFLKDVADANGDLWFERSAHTYDLGEQRGAVVVFPSGYLYGILGAPGTTSQQLMKPRTTLSRMESLIPYLPYEFSNYTGDIGTLALLEAKKRDKKTASKADFDTARTTIMVYAMRLATAMIIDPQMIELIKKSSKAPSVAEPEPEPEPAPAPSPEPEPEVEGEEDEEETEE